tara:strand:+ start:1129 stop:1287 length:159 start_codon:yes stop_codon:yes gene_type:complete
MNNTTNNTTTECENCCEKSTTTYAGYNLCDDCKDEAQSHNAGNALGRTPEEL